MITKLKLYALAALGAVTAILWHLLGKEKAKRKEAERDADMAEAVIKQNDKTNDAVRVVQRIHREEVKNVREKLKADDRSTLDNNW